MSAINTLDNRECVLHRGDGEILELEPRQIAQGVLVVLLHVIRRLVDDKPALAVETFVVRDGAGGSPDLKELLYCRSCSSRPSRYRYTVIWRRFIGARLLPPYLLT